MAERFVQTRTNGYPTTEIQMPWWAGFNEARQGLPYRNDYATVSAKYDYQHGYETGRRA